MGEGDISHTNPWSRTYGMVAQLIDTHSKKKNLRVVSRIRGCISNRSNLVTRPRFSFSQYQVRGLWPW